MEEDIVGGGVVGFSVVGLEGSNGVRLSLTRRLYALGPFPPRVHPSLVRNQVPPRPCQHVSIIIPPDSAAQSSLPRLRAIITPFVPHDRDTPVL